MTAIVTLYGTHQGFKVLRGLLFEILEIFFIREHEIRKLIFKFPGGSQTKQVVVQK